MTVLALLYKQSRVPNFTIYGVLNVPYNVVQKPSILLFDEATSALDSTTEREILASVAELAAGRTAIFVAHRLSTAAQCDNVVVLEQGRVVESGSHSELLQLDGTYAKLWAQHATVDDMDALASAA
jgi:ABC-type transport system involved in Fe-S cluster assembly fused permease/ATPase subunit